MSAQGIDRPDRVIFGVPLISHAKSADWAWTTHQFNATLGSLFGQTDGNFRVVVAAWDEPDINVEVDDRLEFIRFRDPASSEVNELRNNARAKRRALACRARELGGGYLMFVDADDLLSSDLVSFLQRYPHPFGYLVAEGYVLDAMTGTIAPCPMPGYEAWTFDRVCGTSTIMRFAPDELPASDDDTESAFRRLYARGHPGVRPLSGELGRPMADLPVRAVTYVRADRHALSFRLGAGHASYTFHTRLLRDLPQHAIKRTARLDERFNIRAALAPEAAGAD